MQDQESSASTHEDREAPQAYTNPTGSAHARGDDASRAPSQPPQVGFPRFPDLPPELRAAIYQMAIYEDMRAVRTVGTSWGHESPRSAPLAVKTQQAQRYPAGLRHAGAEARREAARACVCLPTRLVTDAGANVVNINQGARLRRMASRYVGGRPFHAGATTFFANEAAAVEVFGLLGRGALDARGLAWLRNLMLDKRTFLHLLGGRHGSFSREEGGPFARLPGLRRIVVGVLRRFQDVAMLEGRYDDVVTEVQVVEDPEAVDEESRWAVRSPYALDRMLELMVMEAARQTRADVEALGRAGVEVVWGVIESGVTRRPDIFEWFMDG